MGSRMLKESVLIGALQRGDSYCAIKWALFFLLLVANGNQKEEIISIEREPFFFLITLSVRLLRRPIG